MGIMIQMRKKNTEFRFWTTIADAWLTEWGTRKQAVNYLKWRAKKRHKAELKEIEENFPNGYWSTDRKYISGIKIK